jgi:hypothetical protein
MYLFTFNVLLYMHVYFRSVNYLDALTLQYVPYLSRIPANTQLALTPVCSESIRRVIGVTSFTE